MEKVMAVKIAIGLIAILLMSGCANQRFYCGFDDYGETQRMNNQWETGGKPEVRR